MSFLVFWFSVFGFVVSFKMSQDAKAIEMHEMVSWYGIKCIPSFQTQKMWPEAKENFEIKRRNRIKKWLNEFQLTFFSESLKSIELLECKAKHFHFAFNGTPKDLEPLKSILCPMMGPQNSTVVFHHSSYFIYNNNKSAYRWRMYY